MSAQPSYPNPLLRGWRFADGVPPPKLSYRMMRRIFQVTICAMWKVRVFYRHYEPASGSAVYICNHQSFLDPMLMSFALRRPMNYMARASLFRIPGFGQLLPWLNAFPLQRGKSDTGALKEAMRRLQEGGQVVVFAEGTRTRDGRIGRFLPGVALLAKRAAEWTVPVLIEGAFESWPRSQVLPSPGQVVVRYGRPIPRSQVRRLSSAELLAGLREQIIDMQADVRRRLSLPQLKYD